MHTTQTIKYTRRHTGTTSGAGTVLDSCTAPSSAFTIGFTVSAGEGTIVQKASGLCLTVVDGGGAPPSGEVSYQPMRKQGAIILATGGDNSNSAKGNFYEGCWLPLPAP
jgi:hypothetical protein